MTPEKTASLRKVQLGVTSGDGWSSPAGLKRGETIVIDSADKLRDGATVTTVQAPAACHPLASAVTAKQSDGKGLRAATSAATSAPAASAQDLLRRPAATRQSLEADLSDVERRASPATGSDGWRAGQYTASGSASQCRGHG